MLDAIEAVKEKWFWRARYCKNNGCSTATAILPRALADGRILSTPHMPPGKVALRDLIIIDADGNKLVKATASPTARRRCIRRSTKARADVQCILHYHPDELIAVAASGQGIKVIANCGVHFYRGTPIYDSPILIRNPQLGDKVAATLGDRNRGAPARPRRHGRVERDLDTLLRLGLDLVRSARIQILCAPLGPVKTHSQEECQQMVKGHGLPNANRRYIDYYYTQKLSTDSRPDLTHEQENLIAI